MDDPQINDRKKTTTKQLNTTKTKRYGAHVA